MKRSKILSLLLSTAMLLSLATVPAAAVEPRTAASLYPDMDGHWSAEAVTRWSNLGILQGDELGNFLPNKYMTRAEFASMLSKLLGYTKMAENIYDDVPADAWFVEPVLKLTAAGVMKGDGGHALPNSPITREQTAVMLCRALDLKPSANAKLNFIDTAEIDDWAKDSVAALAERGMVQGMGDNDFAPTLDINRGSVAQMVSNMISQYVAEDGATVTGRQKGIVIVAAKDVKVEDATLAENLIVAPKAGSATVTLTGNTKAADVLVDAEGAKVVVEKTAAVGSVSLEAPKAAAEISGKADTVGLTAKDASVTVAKDAAVKGVTVAAESAKVSVAGTVDNVTVADTAAGAALTVEKGATVTKVETAADNVTVDGAGKVNNLTVTKGKGVTVSKDTSVARVENMSENVVKVGDKEIKPTSTTAGSSGGGGGGGSNSGGGNNNNGDVGGGPTVTPTAKKYKVKVEITAGKGTVTPSVTETDEAGEITLTVEAQKQTDSELPYVLDTLTVTGPSGTSTDIKSAQKFTPTAEGTYTVKATFVQPITKAGVLVVDGDKVKIADLVAYGYPENPEDAPVTDEKLVASEAAYLFIGVERADKDEETAAGPENLKITFNGTEMTAPADWSGFKNWACAYVSENVVSDDSETNQACTFSFTGSAAAIKVTFQYEGAEYSFTADYTKPGVEVDKLTTVTFKNGSETVATYKGMPAVGTEGDEDYSPAERFTAPAAPTETGYTFGGWKCGEATVTAGDTADFADEDSVYEAQWTPNTYTVAFDLDGGEGDIATITATYDRVLSNEALPEPTKAHYTFGGWFLNNAEVTKDSKNLTATNGGTVTVKAKWTPAEYTVTFNSQGGSAVAEAKVEYNSSVTEPDKPTRDGYEFKGWYTDADCTSAYDFNTAVTGNVTLYAKWEKAEAPVPTTYTVTFKTSEDDSDPTTVEVEENGTVGNNMPEDPDAPEGQEFKGWFTKDNEKFTGETVVTGDITVTAKFDSKPSGSGGGSSSGEVRYIVTFYVNDQEYMHKEVGNAGSDTGEITLGDDYMPDDPTVEGKTFVRWFYTDSENNKLAFTASTPITSNMTVTAEFEDETSNLGGDEVSYTVTFQVGGQEDITVTVEKAEEGDTTLGDQMPKDPTVDENKEFKGWFTENN